MSQKKAISLTIPLVLVLIVLVSFTGVGKKLWRSLIANPSSLDNGASQRSNSSTGERDLVDSTGAVFGKTKTPAFKIDPKNPIINLDEVLAASVDANGVVITLNSDSVLKARGKAFEQGKSKQDADNVASARRSQIAQEHAQSKITLEKVLGKKIVFSGSKKATKTTIRAAEYSSALNGYVLYNVPVAETIEKLKNVPGIKKVEPNYTVRADLTESISQIKADQVWGNLDTSGSPLSGLGIKIGIIDTGIDYTHPDLGGCFGLNCRVVGGYDFINNDGDPMDDNGHGTHVAATAAGNGVFTPNGSTTQTQILGVAPSATIYGYKVLNSLGSGSFAGIISAIERCADPNNDGNYSDRLDVCNLSLGAGGGNPDDAQSLALDNATANGTVFVVAGGNSGPSSGTIGSPGTARDAITVAAACKTSQVGNVCAGPIANFSSRGPVAWINSNGVTQTLQKPDISAPGVLICAAQWDVWLSQTSCGSNNHIAINGTSMAAPHIAGVVALLKQAHPTYTPAQIKNVLLQTAKPFSSIPNTTQGSGIVDSIAALNMAGIPSSLVQVQGLPLYFIDDVSNLSQTFSKTLSIKNITNQSITFTPVFTTAQSGLSATFSATSLVIPAGGSTPFTVNLQINHAVVNSPKSIDGLVTLNSSAGPAKMPVVVNIQNRLVSNVNPVDFGIQNPSNNSWSKQIPFTLKNSLTDSSASYTQSVVCCTSGGQQVSGVSVSVSPNNSSFAPSETKNMIATVTITNNAVLPTGLIEGKIVFSSALETLEIPFKFSKNYAVKLNFSGGNLLNSDLYVYSKTEFARLIQGPSLPSYTMLSASPGPFNFVLAREMFSVTSGNADDLEIGAFAFKRNIDASNEPILNFNWNTGAPYKVSFNPTMPNGSFGPFKVLRYTLADPIFNFAFSNNVNLESTTSNKNLHLWVGGVDSDVKFNTIIATSDAPHGTIATLMYNFNQGINSHLNLTNTVADFGVRTLNVFPNNTYGETPYVYPILCATPLEFPYYRITPASTCSQVPQVKVPYIAGQPISVYSLVQGDTPSNSQYGTFPSVKFVLGTGLQNMQNYAGHSWGSDAISQTPSLFLGKTEAFSWVAPNLKDAHDYFLNRYSEKSIEIPPGNMLYLGSGPLIDSGKWFNYRDFSWGSMYQGIKGLGSGLHLYGDYSSQWTVAGKTVNVGDVPVAFTLKRNGTTVDQGTISPLYNSPQGGGGYMFYNLPATTLISPGSYEFTTTRSGFIAGVNTQTKNTTTFSISSSTTPIDSNPPSLSFARVLSSGLWQQVIDSTKVNTLNFKISPNPKITGQDNQTGGYLYGTDSVASANLQISTNNGSTWTTVPTTLASGVYTATIPITSGISLYTFKISATDSAGNSMIQQFQIPIGTAIVPAGSGDVTPPTVSVTSPTNGTTVSGTINITANATDNVGVTKVDFFDGTTLVGTDTTSPYSVSWDTVSAPNGSHSLTARAFDAAGNSATSNPISVTVSNQQTTCVRSHQSFVTPLTTSTAPGAPVAFTVTVNNNDTNCGTSASVYDMAVNVPPGWTSASNLSNISAVPGVQSTKEVIVTPSASATANTFGITFTFANNALPTQTTSNTAQVVINTATCTRANPSVSLTPASQSTTNPGSTLNYTITTTNNDSAGCSATTFSNIFWGGGELNGFTRATTPSQVTISPGAIATQVLAVTSPATAVAGSYPFNLDVQNTQAVNYKTTVGATYVVQSSGGGSNMSVLITSPASSTIPSKGSFSFRADIASGGPATRIDLSVSGSSINTVTVSCVGTNLSFCKKSIGGLNSWPAGVYTLTATATNSNGEIATATKLVNK